VPLFRCQVNGEHYKNVGEAMMETHQFGGPWTVEKLDALRAYLIGYAQALKNQPFRRHYIDAFAGTGDRALKRQEAASLMEISAKIPLSMGGLSFGPEAVSGAKPATACASLLRRMIAFGVMRSGR
jgi:hypothetical protein